VRILLVQPPLTTAREVAPPLGLCTLAAVLKQDGHDVALLDLDLETKRFDDPRAATFSLFERTVGDFEPQLLAITSMYSNSLVAEDLVRAAKRCIADLPVVAGGPHFGAQPEVALRRLPELDFAVEGEGEAALCSLAGALVDAHHDIPLDRVWRRNGSIVRPDRRGLIDLDTLPNVWRTVEDVVDIGRYAATCTGDRRSVYVEAGRGCPFRCSFCATAPFWERRYRVRPVGVLMDEIRYLHERFGYDSVLLVHDLLTVDKRYVSELSDAFIDARLPVQWMANHRADLDLTGLAPKMRTAGCWKLFFGMESGSQRVQDAVDKHLDVADVENTIATLEGLGITSTCSYVIGFPDETREELVSTLRLAARTRLLGAETVQLHRLRLWPPATLAAAGTPADFDLSALELEYPFGDVSAEHVARAQADPVFFAGYRAPRSTAATAEQLTQIELLFTRAIALLPFTIAAYLQMAGPFALDSFFRHVAEGNRLSRADFDVASLDVLHDFGVVERYCARWFEAADVLTDAQRTLLTAVAEYERRRMLFLFGNPAADDGAIASDAKRVLYECGVNLQELYDTLLEGRPLDVGSDSSGVVFVRGEANAGTAVFHVGGAVIDAVRSAELPLHALIA
jgi:radical SAM superfamily enzyme YgiQ (UPF0313 family)